MHTNSYLQIKDYFRDLVENSEFIQDFVGFFSREYKSREASYYKKGLKSPTLALFRYELGFDGDGVNAVAVRKIGFIIIFNDVKNDDYDEQYKAIHEAENLALKVIARIRWDNTQKEHFLYNSFLQDSVEIHPLELNLNNFGVEVFFNLKNKQSLIVDANDWKDIDGICS